MRFRHLCFIALFSSELIKTAYTSIAGVSYRDDFDFEERYRKKKYQEGPPVFWYLGSAPVPQIVPQVVPQIVQQEVPQIIPEAIPQIVPEIVPQIIPEFHVEYVEYSTTEPTTTTQRILSPFEALFESFKRDISKEPVAPRLETTREFGKVHVYRQPVSYETMKMIMKLTDAYSNAMTYSL